MADTQVRPDIDIEAEIDDILTRYPPLVQDRHHIETDVNKGVVTVSGYTRTPITRAYLVTALKNINGVTEINDSKLYSDGEIRLHIGRVIPVGVHANLDYGVAILTGKPPTETDIDQLTHSVAQIEGVRDVLNRLNTSGA